MVVSKLRNILASEGLVAGLEKSARVTTKKVTFQHHRGRETVTISGDAKAVGLAETYLKNSWQNAMAAEECQLELWKCQDE
ncbi:MAG: hypothetical protein CMJ67_10340 [Planctomycetaceae bacterium]|nr:hypothetical protein [Planctomycetaceae bacterium]